MIGRVSFVTQWLDFGSLKLRLWFGKSMLWINISRINNLTLLKLIGTENTVKIAPFVFVLFFLEGNQMFGRRKMKRMTLKKKRNMFGASIPLTRLYFWTQVILFMFEKNIPFFCVPLHSMSLTFLLNTAILCSCSSILSFSLPTIEMMESSLFLNSLSVRDVARGCRFFLS